MKKDGMHFLICLSHLLITVMISGMTIIFTLNVIHNVFGVYPRNTLSSYLMSGCRNRKYWGLVNLDSRHYAKLKIFLRKFEIQTHIKFVHYQVEIGFRDIDVLDVQDGRSVWGTSNDLLSYNKARPCFVFLFISVYLINVRP